MSMGTSDMKGRGNSKVQSIPRMSTGIKVGMVIEPWHMTFKVGASTNLFKGIPWVVWVLS